MADNNSTPPFRIFPAVHGNELSERNERRGRYIFFLLVPKKIRRRGSKKTSDLSTTVTTSTGQDDFENPSHQALQPRPILDAWLVSLNFASTKNIFDSVFLLSKPKWAKASSVTTRFISMSRKPPSGRDCLGKLIHSNNSVITNFYGLPTGRSS